MLFSLLFTKIENNNIIMKTIVEKLMDLEYKSIEEMLDKDENIVDEGLKDVWQNVKDKFKMILRKIKNRVIMCFTDGTAIPAVSPLTTGLAVGAGEGGQGTYFVGAGNIKGYGIKNASMSEIIKNAEANKKSIFEASELTDERFEQIVKEAFEQLSLSGKNQYGPDVDEPALKFYLNVCIKKGEKGSPLLIWGAPGIGKTAIVKQVLKEFYKKKVLITKNLGQCQKDDFSLPAFEKDVEGKITGVDEVPKTWLPMYKKTGDPAIDAIRDNIANGGTKEGEIGEGGVIFFDELARCRGDVQGVALTLIEDRELVGHVLGSKWSIISASNREIDDPNMDITLSKALGNRFAQVNFVPSYSDWENWAKSKEFMSNEILNFLHFNQKYWYFMRPDDDMEKVFASPRSWTKACQMLYNLSMSAKEDGWSLDDIMTMPGNDNRINIIQQILSQYVQPEVAEEFMAYYRLTLAVDIDALHSVWKNPDKAPNLKKGKDGKDLRADIKYYMVSKVLCGLDTNVLPTPEEMANLAKWLVTSKDESVAASACHILFDMYKTDPNKIQFMLGNPDFALMPQYKKTWNKYEEFVQILIAGIPGMDKEINVDLSD